MMPELPSNILQCTSLKDIPQPPTEEQTNSNDPDWVAIASYMKTMESKLVICAHIRDSIPEWWGKQKALVDKLNVEEEKKK